MAGTIELPENLVDDLEQEAARWHLPLAEMLREALQVWRASREPAVSERERVMCALRDRGLLCQLPAALVAGSQRLAPDEVDELARKAAQGGPVSALIVKERRGEL